MGAADWYSLDEGEILVVGEAPEGAGLLAGTLSAAGYRVRPVPNGPLALRAVEREPPDLILLEVDAPGTDGLEVCRALRAVQGMGEVPVILVRGDGEAADRAEGLCGEGVDSIGKPYRTEEVVARVRTQLLLRRLQQQVAAQTARLEQQGEALSRAIRRQDELLAAVSHELRTPLNAILGISEVLCEGAYGPLSERQVAKVRAIEESGRQLLDVMDDILDLSKIEAGQMSLDIGTVLVERVCRESLGFVRPSSLRKHLQFSFSTDAAVTTLQADERRLKQILVNLLSNAVKFTPEGGAAGLEVVGDAERGIARFTVWDTGTGIAEEALERLDEPVVRLAGRLSGQQGGTDLGLSLVRGLTEAHGGGLSIESRAGEGNRFTVSLPWQGPAVEGSSTAPQASGVAAGAPVPAMADGGPLILLAEDDQANVEAVLNYLEAKGYRVIVARDGSEAVDLARERLPDLILMDIQMPGTDGLEAIRRIRNDVDPASGRTTEVAETPIIAVTALAMPGDEERCLAAGADAYLSKPVRLRQLVEVMAEQLRAGRALQTSVRAM